MNLKKKYQWTVNDLPEEIQLGKFVRDRLENAISLRAVKKLVEHGTAKVNSKPEKFSTFRLSKGDRVEFEIIDSLINPPKLIISPSMILYEDDSLLALNKPSGFSSVPESERLPDLSTEVQKYFEGRYISLLHRLDKDTSGILLFAKNKVHESRYLEQFRTHSIKKTYIARVYGNLKLRKGKILTHIGLKETRGGVGKWGNVTQGQGKEALTFYKTLKEYKDSSLVELRPVTGRTHQLRVHMASMGHPILGDSIYGTNQSLKISAERLMLHAFKISIKHALRDMLLEIEAPLPEIFLSTKL